MTDRGQEFYSSLAVDIAEVVCSGYAWKLLAALPEPWEVPAPARRNVCNSPEGPENDSVECLSLY